MKIRCCKCNAMADWMYMPSCEDRDTYYCGDHVSRGCSCNIDPETDIEDKDESGRLLPCCEYNYSEDGYDNDKTLDDSDKYDDESYDD